MRRGLFGAVPLAGALALHLGFSLKILPAFTKMFADFGGELPTVTKVALSPAWAFGWGAWLLVGGGVGVMRLIGGRRPSLLLVVLGTMSAVWIVSIFAMYLPIFGIANAIKG